jgi:hypothetical protein
MGLLDRIFKKMNREKAYWDNAPFLCPWYFDKTRPRVEKDGQLLEWNYLDKIHEKYVGIVTLKNRKKDDLGILKAYTYVLPNQTGDKFLIWTRKWKDNNDFPKIAIELFRSSDLKPINDIDKVILDIGQKEDVNYFFNAFPSGKVEFIINPDTPINILFGQEFHEFNDFCIINDVPGLYKDGNELWHNTAIIFINIMSGHGLVYPQDWFNKDESIDYGYQWLTRAIKSPDTNLIQGQGMRMNDFNLDETNRRLK